MHPTCHRKIHRVAGAGWGRGDLVDNAHHSRVRITPDCEHVTEVEAVRYPWTKPSAH